MNPIKNKEQKSLLTLFSKLFSFKGAVGPGIGYKTKLGSYIDTQASLTCITEVEFKDAKFSVEKKAEAKIKASAMNTFNVEASASSSMKMSIEANDTEEKLLRANGNCNLKPTLKAKASLGSKQKNITIGNSTIGTSTISDNKSKKSDYITLGIGLPPFPGLYTQVELGVSPEVGEEIIDEMSTRITEEKKQAFLEKMDRFAKHAENEIHSGRGFEFNM